MAFKDEYPHLFGCVTWFGFMLIICVGNALYVNHRYNEGVEQGRAQQLCEIGEMAKLPNLPPACRRWLAETTPKDTLHDPQ